MRLTFKGNLAEEVFNIVIVNCLFCCFVCYGTGIVLKVPV